MRRVFNGLVTLVNGIGWVGLAISGVFILLMIGVVVHGVFMRYVLRDPQAYSLEFSRYAMMPVVALALAYTQRVRGHVSVTLVTQLLPRTVQKVLLQVVYLVFLAYAVALILASWDKTMVFWQGGMKTEEAKLPFWPISAVMSLGLAAVCLQLVVDFIKGIVEFRSTGPTPAGGHS